MFWLLLLMLLFMLLVLLALFTMLARFPFLAHTGLCWGCFFGVVLGVASCALLGGSKTILEPNLASTWVDFGAVLATFWTIFGCCFGFSS